MEIAQNFMGKGAKMAMQRINESNTVLGTIIVNREGFPETTTLDSLSAATYATHMRTIALHSNNALKEIDSSNAVVVVRVVTKKTEVIVAPDSEFHLVVVMRKRNL